jgi:FlaA1/EpsC-like NDP-sugar epimerase
VAQPAGRCGGVLAGLNSVRSIASLTPAAFVNLENKRILITGGTGSLGKTLVRRLLRGDIAKPAKIIVFSRDESKQHDMRVAYRNRTVASEDIIYHNFDSLVEFRIGDVRDYASISSAVRAVDVVFNTAALKQVPSSEYFPFETAQTNIIGAQNILRAVQESSQPPELVIGISTDKACKPVNVMGMTKALQERILLTGGLTCHATRFACVRYGNVLASRGSVIPLFIGQIDAGGPVTVTSPDMTRFLLTLDDAVDLIVTAVKGARSGDTYIPRVPSARVGDIAAVMVEGTGVPVKVTGIRPGEKMHEVLISEEEAHRTVVRGNHFVIQNILPELAVGLPGDIPRTTTIEYSSADALMDRAALKDLLSRNDLMPSASRRQAEEIIR